MNLLDQLNADLKDAMRQGDEVRKLTLRAVKTAIRQEEVAGDEARTLSDEEVVSVIAKQAKQRRDSIAEFKKGGRQDLVQQEEAELQVLEAYLPRQLTRAEIAEQAKQVIAEVGASGPRDMGNVMRPLMDRLRGQADGKVVSQVVQELLRTGSG